MVFIPSSLSLLVSMQHLVDPPPPQQPLCVCGCECDGVCVGVSVRVCVYK